MFKAGGRSLLAVGADTVGEGPGSTETLRNSGRTSLASQWPCSFTATCFGELRLLGPSPGVLVLAFFRKFADLFDRYPLVDELCRQGQGLGLVGLVFYQEDRLLPAPTTDLSTSLGGSDEVLSGRVTCPSCVFRRLPRTKGLVCFLCPAAGLSGLLACGLPHHLHLPLPP